MLLVCQVLLPNQASQPSQETDVTQACWSNQKLAQQLHSLHDWHLCLCCCRCCCLLHDYRTLCITTAVLAGLLQARHCLHSCFCCCFLCEDFMQLPHQFSIAAELCSEINQ
jgi:hypothetical protein